MQYICILLKVKLHFVDWHQDPDEVLFVWSNPEQGTEQAAAGTLSSFNYVSSVTNELSWLHLIRVGTNN